MLNVVDLGSGYGRVQVLHGVTLDVAKGEIVALLGSNGTGKTTLLRAISGVQPLRGGTVTLDGIVLTRFPPHARVAQGLVQVPEGRQVFAPLSVEDNLRLGAYRRAPAKGAGAALAHVYDLFPILAERRHQPAGELSGGQQQMLALGRAMMADPRMLLLDEPSMGLAPIMVEQIFAAVQRLNDEGVTILLVEQNAHAALRIANRAYVLENGAIALEGNSADLANDQRVREAYLGG